MEELAGLPVFARDSSRMIILVHFIFYKIHCDFFSLQIMAFSTLLTKVNPKKSKILPLLMPRSRVVG